MITGSTLVEPRDLLFAWAALLELSIIESEGTTDLYKKIAVHFGAQNVGNFSETDCLRSITGGGNSGSLGALDCLKIIAQGSDPSPPPMDVADADARLSLPSNTPVGIKVHQVDNDTIYELVTVPAVTLSGTSVNGVYTKRGINDSRDYYNLVAAFPVDTQTNAIVWNNTTVVSSHVAYPVNGWSVYDSGAGVIYTSTVENLTVGLPSSLVDSDAGQVRIRQGNAGIDLTIQFNSLILLAASSGDSDSGDAVITIGTLDSPTRIQIASKIAALTNFPPFSANLTATSSGEQVTFHQPYQVHMGQFFTNNEGGWINAGTTYTADDKAAPDLVSYWYSVNDVAPATIGVALNPTYKDVSLEECWSIVP